MPDSEVSVTDRSVDKILIWDAESPHPQSGVTTVLWRAFATSESADIVSIPKLIEENADVLRARYLEWVYELGESRLLGRRLVDHLQLRPGFSYWWMTLLVEKCNYSKSPQINDAIRLLAFTDWAVRRSITHITLASANAPLAKCLRGWCEKTGVAFRWQPLPKSQVPLPWHRRVFAVLPVAMQAWVWLLKYLLERWPLRGVGLQNWKNTKGMVTFVSYLFNLVPEARIAGKYESRYWGLLPDVLRREGCRTNWLHLYVKDPLLSDAKKAAEAIRTFNQKDRDIEIHTTLDSFLSLNILRQVLQDWVKLVWTSKKLNSSIASAATQTNVDLWPLFSVDWQESTTGVTAMCNILNQRLQYAAVKLLPKQAICFYLQENQGWEFSLIQNWKIADQGHLVGVPHSSVRFWDLRYFFDPRSYNRNTNKHIPLPDKVAVNGPAATDAYLKGGYPAEELAQVEALRYIYLGKTGPQLFKQNVTPKMGLRLLVLGDYLMYNTQVQMRLLEKAAAEFPAHTEITVKPHPACPIRSEDFPKLQLTVTMEPLSELLTAYDVAYTSAVTTAAMDAYCAGIPVISVADPNTLNLSPLRCFPNTKFVSTENDLIAVIKEFSLERKIAKIQQSIFNTNPELALWRKLIDNSVPSSQKHRSP